MRMVGLHARTRIEADAAAPPTTSTGAAAAVPHTDQRRELVRQLTTSTHPLSILGETPSGKLSLRQSVYRLLERPSSSRPAKAVLMVLMVCIFLSIGVFFFKSRPELERSAAIFAIEATCTVVFTLELLVRLYVGTLDPMNLICRDFSLFCDFLSVVPWYVETILEVQQIDSITGLELLQLFRLLRVLKLMRHYSGWRVLIIALERSWRPVMVPVFAMVVTILVLSGVLYVVETIAIVPVLSGRSEERLSHGVNVSRLDISVPPSSVGDLWQQTYLISEETDGEALTVDAFECVWAVFWLVTTLGYDGSLGTGHPVSRLVVACALLCGLLFTTMPITIIGGAFATAWEQKEVVEVAMKVQELLVERGHSAREVRLVFDAFDSDGNCALDWFEFKRAMRVLECNLPVDKMRRLFALFDADDSGTVDHEEFCRLLFPSVANKTFDPVTGPERSSPRPGQTPRAYADGVADEGEAPDEAAAKREAQEAAAAHLGVPSRAEHTAASDEAGALTGAQRGLLATRQAAGKLSWHQWRNTSDAQQIFKPMLMQEVSAVSAAEGGGVSSIVEAARAEAAKMRTGVGASSSPKKVAAGSGAAGVQVADLAKRMDRLEENVGAILRLLQHSPGAPDAAPHSLPPLPPRAR